MTQARDLAVIPYAVNHFDLPGRGRRNNDALDSLAWLDLGGEPVT